MGQSFGQKAGIDISDFFGRFMGIFPVQPVVRNKCDDLLYLFIGQHGTEGGYRLLQVGMLRVAARDF